MTSNLISILKVKNTTFNVYELHKRIVDDHHKISSNHWLKKSDSFQFTMNYCFEVFAGIKQNENILQISIID